MDKKSKQERKRLEKEVDIWLIRDNLKASYEARVERHQDMLDFIEALNEIKRRARSKSPKTPPMPH